MQNLTTLTALTSLLLTAATTNAAPADQPQAQIRIVSSDGSIRPSITVSPRQGPYLGVQVAPAPLGVTRQLDLADGEGLQVASVLPGTPAAKAGIEPFDVLHKLGEDTLTSTAQLAGLLRDHRDDGKIALTVYRKGEAKDVAVSLDAPTPAARPRVRVRQGGTANAEVAALEGYVAALRAQKAAAAGNAADAIDARLQAAEQALADARQRAGQKGEGATAGVTLGDLVDGAATGKRTVRSTDPLHRITLVETKVGKRKLTVTDADGNTVLEKDDFGPSDAATLPNDIRLKVKRLDRTASRVDAVNDRAKPLAPEAEPGVRVRLQIRRADHTITVDEASEGSRTVIVTDPQGKLLYRGAGSEADLGELDPEIADRVRRLLKQTGEETKTRR